MASDGESLRLFQAVIDARTLLAEIATSERRHKDNTVTKYVSQCYLSSMFLYRFETYEEDLDLKIED